MWHIAGAEGDTASQRRITSRKVYYLNPHTQLCSAYMLRKVGSLSGPCLPSLLTVQINLRLSANSPLRWLSLAQGIMRADSQVLGLTYRVHVHYVRFGTVVLTCHSATATGFELQTRSCGVVKTGILSATWPSLVHCCCNGLKIFRSLVNYTCLPVFEDLTS